MISYLIIGIIFYAYVRVFENLEELEKNEGENSTIPLLIIIILFWPLPLSLLGMSKIKNYLDKKSKKKDNK